MKEITPVKRQTFIDFITVHNLKSHPVEANDFSVMQYLDEQGTCRAQAIYTTTTRYEVDTSIIKTEG